MQKVRRHAEALRPLVGTRFQVLFHSPRLTPGLVTAAGSGTIRTRALRPPTGNACPLTPVRFRLVPFRSPLLGESRLISSRRGTEMCQFPRLPSRTYVFSP